MTSKSPTHRKPTYGIIGPIKRSMRTSAMPLAIKKAKPDRGQNRAEAR
jgi:hypothetical protein